VRIARYTTGEDPTYGIVQGEPGHEIVAEIQGDPLYQPIVPTGVQVPLEDVRLLAPVIPRSKVIGIGKNYADHAAEMGSEAPLEPLMFLIPNTAVVGPGDPVVMPRQTAEVHYEGELAVVIRRICKDVPPERVKDVIYGYTCANDVTDRAAQASDSLWTEGKSRDTFTPLGPWIRTDLDPADVPVRLSDDRQPGTQASTRGLARGVTEVLGYLTSIMTLHPGDVVLTGAPGPSLRLHPGGTSIVSIPAIGDLVNSVMLAEKSSPAMELAGPDRATGKVIVR